MANRLKKSTIPSPIVEEQQEVIQEKPQKKAAPRSKAPAEEKLKKDREERIDLKKLAKDERTWKIIGTVSLLISIFLFIAFVSYLFTWKEDQDKVLDNDSTFLGESDVRVANLLGRLGAYVSHFFIYRGFGIASMLFCTFFFVVGINLLFERKVFNIWRNLKYVTFGLLIASVSIAFLLPDTMFPYGGRVGDMINNWLNNFLGFVGTGALLLVVLGSYLIWQFNPTFKIPERKNIIGTGSDEEDPVFETEADLQTMSVAPSGNGQAKLYINDLYTEQEVAEKRNALKGEGEMNFIPLDEETGLSLEI
ncbi:MAG TPA: DNA translocase FtsK 4TM domain-containing protein, partial [Flavisolibacter sp.]|nr:DNA translocase FtsK 4TM domain-containing protein [Flavisolibacter sp.]